MLTISHVQVAHTDQEDILYWTSASSGRCTTEEAYKLLAVQCHQLIPTIGSRALPQNVPTLLQVIWKMKTLQPKLKTFAWRLLRQALATGERAGKYSTKIDQNCKLCNIIETDAHLFFECPFVRAVWYVGDSPIRADALPIGP